MSGNLSASKLSVPSCENLVEQDGNTRSIAREIDGFCRSNRSKISDVNLSFDPLEFGLLLTPKATDTSNISAGAMTNSFNSGHSGLGNHAGLYETAFRLDSLRRSLDSSESAHEELFNNALVEQGIYPGITSTVMLRNIPARYTPEALSQFVDMAGFKDVYDYIHIPMDFRSRCSKGYAFINFSIPALVPLFASQITDRTLCDSKVLRVCGAVHQGLHENVNSIKPSSLRHMVKQGFGPLIRNSDGTLNRLNAYF